MREGALFGGGAGYFTIGVFMDLFMLGVISFAALQYGTNTPVFMAAIREVCCVFPAPVP